MVIHISVIGPQTPIDPVQLANAITPLLNAGQQITTINTEFEPQTHTVNVAPNAQ